MGRGERVFAAFDRKAIVENFSVFFRDDSFSI